MSTGSKKLRVLATAALFAFAMGSLISAHATVNVSQVPLLVSTSVEPNVVFIIDDSGSMQWETMPDELTKHFGGNTNNDLVMWTFPRISGLHGGSDYNNTRTVRFEGTDTAAFFRSAHKNTVYYNPAVTYRPWSNADGSLMPNADPVAAPNRPLFSFGERNLTVEHTQSTNWLNDLGTTTNESVTFYPAVYFQYKGVGDDYLASSYDRVEIRPANAPFEGHGRENRTDCVNAGATPPSCTYAEEIQNFANWYTYHRNRIFAGRAAIGTAFAAQGSAMRVGYGAINQGNHTVDGASTRTVVRGVRPFAGADRLAFFDDLYSRPIPTAGTPLRLALRGAGEYFERDDDQGPWSSTPGQSGGEDLECRQSFSILMSDGYWNETATIGVGNQDGSGNTTWTAPGGGTGGYTVGPPFEDAYSNTLADVAMRFWKNDLRTDLENKVPTSAVNPAFWQHMVTFTVGLGVFGTIDPDDAFAAIETGTAIAWPDPHPASADAAKIDDMLHAAVNSRGGFFSASDADTFAKELSDVLVNITDRVGSAAAVTANSTRLETGTRIYQARFNSGNWTGDLLALAINPNGSVAPTNCEAMGTWAPGTWCAAQMIPSHGLRNIVSYRPGSGGIEFRWAQMSAAQQALLNADGNGAIRVDYLRGSQAQEQSNSGPFRNRVSLLGDIVNSNPAFMGRQDFGFYYLPTAAEKDTYRDFLDSKDSRPETLFVGANDGMLHAIDVATGEERFAFVPNAVYANLSELSDPAYSHRFFVDGSPRLLDAYLPAVNSAQPWRTVLVGSTGAGGRSVFALDVTDPQNFGPQNVLWEFTHAELGQTVGQPSIARMPNGQWVALFGNGYNSTSHTAQLFIVDLATGALVRRIDTGVGSSADSNGLSSPVPISVTGDRVTTMAYAGDLHGNMWKFDLSSSSNTGNWQVQSYPGPGVNPLFKAVGPSGERQSITVRPTVGRHPDGGQMVYFGTGKFFEVGDNVVPPNPPIQSFYGIRDYAGARVTGRSELQEQTIIAEGLAGSGAVFDYRVTSDNDVDYATKKGWFLDLVSPLEGANGERVIGEALLRHGRIIFVTVIPSDDPCDYGGSSWLMEMDAVSGKRLPYAVFDVDGDGVIDGGDALTITVNGQEIVVHAGGQRIPDVVTTPHVLDTGGDTEFKYMSGASGQVTVVEEAASGINLGRQSWEQLR
jgi:type IV pilus assembly protein PilY1